MPTRHLILNFNDGIIERSELGFQKKNDLEICCVNQYSKIILDQMETRIFTIYMT